MNEDIVRDIDLSMDLDKLKASWSSELRLVENYIFDEITKKLDTYGVEDVVNRCVENSENFKKIWEKLISIEALLQIVASGYQQAQSWRDWNTTYFGTNTVTSADGNTYKLSSADISSTCSAPKIQRCDGTITSGE